MSRCYFVITSVFCLRIRRAPSSNPTDTLLPNTTLFRSRLQSRQRQQGSSAATAGDGKCGQPDPGRQPVDYRSDGRKPSELGLPGDPQGSGGLAVRRSEEHTSELQSLMRISYAVFCLKKTKKQKRITTKTHIYTRNNKRIRTITHETTPQH